MFMSNKGFSLIEVLVSLVLLSISLLAFIASEAIAVNNTTIARFHSLAALMSTSMASAMRANPAFWETYSPAQLAPESLTITASAGQDTFSETTLSDTTLNSYSTNCTTSSCTAAAQAAYDIKMFGMSVANLLPNGSAKIACGFQSNLSPVSCVITISWSEKDIALYKNISVTKNSASAKSYSMVVQP